MAINRNALLKLAEKTRKIRAPISMVRVTVRQRTWPAKVGVGTPTDVDLLLPAYVKVREMNDREVASSGGLLKMGDVEVGPVTPKYPTGGFTQAQLAPEAPTPNVEIIYLLSGAMTGEYRRKAFNTDKAFRYMLTLRRRNVPD